MSTNEEKTIVLKAYVKKLNEYRNWITNHKSELWIHFLREYDNWLCYDEDGQLIPRNDAGFEKIISTDLKYIEKQEIFSNKVLDLNLGKENKFNKQIISLLDSCISEMKNERNLSVDNNLMFELRNRFDFQREYRSILLLSRFAEIESNIVLIGGNGSGKTSFANALKGNDTENICVIPAQKSLYFSMNDMSMLSTRVNDMVTLLLENNINKSKVRDDYGYYQFHNSQFTKLIVAMKEQYVAYLMECDKEQKIADQKKSIYGRLKKIYHDIFPDIELEFASEAAEYLDCKKNGKSYHVNALSEGEKAVIYYTVSVLMAKKDSFVVVDEPETYLNPSLTNLLWDLLLKERKDCQFIVITHSVDFVLGRSDSKIAWIKKFNYPDEWDFDFVKDDFALPKMLMTEILGSKKPVIFCEGDDKSSLDYRIYRSLLEEQYTVIPVGGHSAVIKNCEVLLNSPFLGIEAIGIVDGDYYTDEKVTALESKKVRVLPFNEIEMFLLSDVVMEYTMKSSYPMDYQTKISAFKEKFFETVDKEKERIALYNTMLDTNEFLTKEKIQQCGSVEEIEENLLKISHRDVKMVYSEKIEQIQTIVQKKDYEQLLKVCNLKAEITRGLANRMLDSDYVIKATQQIQANAELKELLRKEYFTW